MAAAAVACLSDEEEDIRSMAEEGVDREYEEILPTLRSEVTRSLREMESPPCDQDQLYSFTQLDWADGVEDSAVAIAGEMAQDGDDYRHGATVFAGRPGEEALVETLQGHAVWSDAKHAEAEEIVAAARRLRARCLRTIAAGETADLVGLAAVEYLAYMSKDKVHHGGELIPLFREAAMAEEVDAVARAQGHGVRFTQKFAKRAKKLRRGAEAFAGEEALAEALQDRAASVEALCADAEAFVGKIVSSPYWRLWRALNYQ